MIRPLVVLVLRSSSRAKRSPDRPTGRPGLGGSCSPARRSAPAVRQVLLLCVWLFAAAAAAAGEERWGAWAEAAAKQHPLAGTFYWPRRGPLWVYGHAESIGYEGKFRRDDDSAGRLYRSTSPDSRGPILLPLAKIFLLGEVHDNPMHHKIRAWLIENRPVRSSWGAVVFEQIRTDQGEALERLKPRLDAGTATAGELFQALDWDKSGWPPSAIYQPLFQAVLSANLPIYPGEPARDRVRALARGGTSTIDADERARLRLDDPLPAALVESLSQELAASHCGALPPQAIPGLAAAQRYRDAHLADALLKTQERHGSAILVAGNGHVRSDRGVPWYIRQRKPDARVMSVMLLEVEEGKTDPAAYLPRDPEGNPAADLVIFTLPAEREDPCRSLLEKKR